MKRNWNTIVLAVLAASALAGTAPSRAQGDDQTPPADGTQTRTQAQTETRPQTQKQPDQTRPLTQDDVARYLETAPAVRSLGDRHAQQQADVDAGQPLTSAMAALSKDDDARRELDELVRQHGFADVREWADVGDRIMNAYRVMDTTRSPEEIQAAYEQGVANIRDNKDMTDIQKKAILAAMEKRHRHNLDVLKAAQPDLPAVQAHRDAVQAFFE